MEVNRPILDLIRIIHTRLAGNRYPNRPQLAAALEVDVRTVSRYLDFMRDRLNLPIEFNRARGGYYYTKAVDRLPVVPEAVSEAELFAMLVATKALAQYQGTPWHAPLERAFRKMTSNLDTSDLLHLEELGSALDIRVSGPDELDPAVFGTLTEAITKRRPLEFDYRKHAQQSIEHRRIRPYQIAAVLNRFYLIGHDLDRDAVRVFVVGRIREPRLLAGRFTRPGDFSGADYLKRSFGIFRGTSDYRVVIELDSWAADVFRDRRWHSSQQVEESSKGGLRVSFQLDNLEEIESWVLAWGIHATVLEPVELTERLKKIAQKVAEKYPGE
jgi:proteasome accessory factor B